jgi:transcriptional regulator of arginine metabolism
MSLERAFTTRRSKSLGDRTKKGKVKKMKTARQKKILELIAQKDIETQNQLIDELAAVGVKSTQATLSRDIKELRLMKELTGGGRYRYAAASRDDAKDNDLRLKKIFRESVISYAAAQNILVLIPLPGLADAACSALDSMDIPGLVGTIAGDDTAFIAMKDSQAVHDLETEVEKLL